MRYGKYPVKDVKNADSEPIDVWSIHVRFTLKQRFGTATYIITI